MTSSQCRTGQQRADKWQNWPLNHAVKGVELLWGDVGVEIRVVFWGVFLAMSDLSRSTQILRSLLLRAGSLVVACRVFFFF